MTQQNNLIYRSEDLNKNKATKGVKQKVNF